MQKSQVEGESKSKSKTSGGEESSGENVGENTKRVGKHSYVINLPYGWPALSMNAYYEKWDESKDGKEMPIPKVSMSMKYDQPIDIYSDTIRYDLGAPDQKYHEPKGDMLKVHKPEPEYPIQSEQFMKVHNRNIAQAMERYSLKTPSGLNLKPKSPPSKP